MPSSRFFSTGLCVLFLLATTSACEAQRDRWDERDTWQNVSGIFEAMHLAPGAWVADIGCREGYLTVRLAKAVGADGRVFAVDIDEEALEDLRDNLEAGMDHVVPVLGETNDPRLPANALDAVVIVNAYHEFDAYEPMLAHIMEALKPGGRLVLVEPIAARRREASRERQASSHEIGIDFAREDLNAAGFEIVEAEDPFVEREHRNDDMWLLVGRRPVE